MDTTMTLKLDAAVTGANGLAYLALAAPLEDLLGLDPALTRWVGAFLAVFAGALWVIAMRPTPSRAAVTVVAEANALWAIGSIAFAVLAVSSPTTVGTVWIVAQALVVAGFATLQFASLRSYAAA